MLLRSDAPSYFSWLLPGGETRMESCVRTVQRIEEKSSVVPPCVGCGHFRENSSGFRWCNLAVDHDWVDGEPFHHPCQTARSFEDCSFDSSWVRDKLESRATAAFLVAGRAAGILVLAAVAFSVAWRVSLGAPWTAVGMLGSSVAALVLFASSVIWLEPTAWRLDRLLAWWEASRSGRRSANAGSLDVDVD